MRHVVDAFLDCCRGPKWVIAPKLGDADAPRSRVAIVLGDLLAKIVAE
jgi:hypothetical protein